MAVENSRNLAYKAAWLKDHGRPIGQAAAMAKLYSTEAAVDATRTPPRCSVAPGSWRRRPIARFYRDAKILEIGEGTSEIQRLVIARASASPSSSRGDGSAAGAGGRLGGRDRRVRQGLPPQRPARRARDLLQTLAGLGEYDIRRPLTATGTNLLGLVKHLSTTEAWYFGDVFGQPFPGRWPRWDDPAGHLGGFWATADETPPRSSTATGRRVSTRMRRSMRWPSTRPGTSRGGRVPT